MNKKYLLYASWLISLMSVIGSLFFSEVLHIPPCVLCWYQRVFMYPLAFIFPIAIIRRDKNVYAYTLPLGIIGLTIAAYHNLLYYHILSESIIPCTNGISCTTKQLQLLGFITIPLLSLFSFAIITLCMVLFKRANRT